MGRIKELKDKQAEGKLSDEEEKELNDLLAEAKDATATDDGDSGDEGDSDEADVDAAADKLVEAINAGFKPMQDLASRLETPAQPKGSSKEVKLIVDKEMGKVPVEKLDEVKIEVPGRQNKQYQHVTKKTLHFLEAMITGDKQKLQVLVEGTNALGGFLVPEEWSNILVEDRRDATVMRGLASNITVSTDTFHLPFVDTRPNVAWRAEAAAKATSTSQFGEITLTPYSLAAIVGLSDELVADAKVGGSVVQIVTRQLIQAIAEKEDEAFFVGSGSGQPTGLDDYTFTEVGPGAGATDVQRADAYKNSYFRLPQGYRNNAVYFANARTWGRAHTLKDQNNNYLLQRLADEPVPRLNGRPAYEVNSLADGKVFFGDPSYYYIADREGIRVKQSQDATVASQSAFERDLTFVRVEERVDAELVYTRAFVELNNMGAI